MMTTTADLLRSPRAAQIAERLNRALQDEAARRVAFLDGIDEDDKAEFVNGEIIMHSPARAAHNRVTMRAATLLHLHAVRHDLGLVGVEKWMVSLTRNDYEPDVCFWPKTVAETFSPDQMRFPAPALVCEVLSPSTRRHDLGVKREDYAAHGVAEYWVADPAAATLQQFVLGGDSPDADADAYDLRLLSDSGTVRSVAVEGFAAPVPALFDDAAYREALGG